MSWLLVTLTTGRDRAASIEAALEAGGALALTLQDAGDEPQLEPPPGAQPLWRQVRVTALFADSREARGRAEALVGSLAPQLTAPTRFEHLADQPWERAWMDDFRPTRFGRRLWVCPRRQAVDAEEAVVVTLDPGLAFGTGHHPTTALCLRWLDAAPLRGAAVMDYGCGSGILAIAAVKLGAERAVAVDHDPQALAATTANAAENGVADRLLACAPGDCPESVVDVLVANILAGPLVELEPAFAALLGAGGRLALSGLLEEQVAGVARAYHRRFDVGAVERDGGWSLLSARRRH
jgi:ribosomal protein L11 methyltransferase